MKGRTKEEVLVLHNIRSVYNVGAIFRTADAIGVSKIFLTGYTPSPLDRFGRPRNDLAKSALGAEKTMSWAAEKNISGVIKKLKTDKFFIVGLEQDEKAEDYKKLKPKNKTALILGNEVSGISKNIREKCDALIQIPMRGGKESLNVSVAAGIAMYRMFDR